ncbi:MAG: hypothetical protein ABIR29_06410 [Chthoniobacterales bacterium]
MHLPFSISTQSGAAAPLPRHESALTIPSTRRSLKILFPPGHDWETNIRTGFAASAHEIAFADFTPENIRQYDLIVPLTIADLYLLNDLREAVYLNPIPIPSRESVALCDDKLLLNRTLIASGFGRCIPRLGPAHRYPYVLKKRIDEWGLNSHIVSAPEDEATLRAKVADADYFCQECIFGRTEYTTHVVCRRGRIVRSTTIKVWFEEEVFIKGREPDCGRSLCDSPYLDLFEQILRSIGLEGLCCFNYKVENSEPMIFEINPRFGASLAPVFAEFIDYLTPARTESF